MKPLVACLLGSVAWAFAFAWGRTHGALYASLAAVACVIVVVTLIVSREQHALWWPMTKPVHDAALGVLVGVVTLVATYVGYPLVRPWFGDEVRALYVLAAITPQALGLTLVVIVGEEVLWRGALTSSLLARCRPWVAIALASVVYGAAQGGSGSVLLVVAAVAFGLVWGALRVWTGGLVAPLIAHLLWTPVVLGAFPLEHLP
jgi:membrane protease YdiL (CAAX protease family)